jgi:hypothetical protein
MPDSRVTNAEIAGDSIVLTVNVDDFAPGGYVEVSGCATQAAYDTQTDGGFATFSEIQEIDRPNPGETAELKVKAKFTKKFQDGLDVIVVVRVAKVWVTVLSQGASTLTEGSGSMSWASLKGVGGPDDYSSAQGSDGEAVAGAPPSAPAG